MLHPDELCICGHTLEVHFGHECTVVAGSKPWIREDCRCKEFAICDSAVDIFEALKEAIPFLKRFAQHVRDETGLEWTHVDAAVAKAEVAIRLALRENP